MAKGPCLQKSISDVVGKVYRTMMMTMQSTRPMTFCVSDCLPSDLQTQVANAPHSLTLQPRLYVRVYEAVLQNNRKHQSLAMGVRV